MRPTQVRQAKMERDERRKVERPTATPLRLEEELLVFLWLATVLIAFFVIRRRRQTKGKSGDALESENYHQPNHILSSMENSYHNPPSSSPPFDTYTQPKSEDQKPVSYPLPPQQYIAMQEYKAELDGRPKSGAASPQMIPIIPPPLSSHLSAQDHIQQLQHQIADRQEKLVSQGSNPQCNPAFNLEMHAGEGFRGPRRSQRTGVLVSSGGNYSEL